MRFLFVTIASPPDCIISLRHFCVNTSFCFFVAL
nr:MAG TPA: hypothetical protein [Caudoviricetes sp.]